MEFLVSLVPSLGALFLLWIGLRAIFQADRRERAAMARFDADYDRAHPAPGAEEPPAAGSSGSAGSAGSSGSAGAAGLAAEPGTGPDAGSAVGA